MNHLNLYSMVDKFSSIPIINGFYFHFVVYSGIDQDAPEKIDTDWWWNVITFGDMMRLTEIAFCPFRDKGSIYIRQKHDNDWSEWFKLNNYINKPKTTIVNIILSDVEWIQSSQGMFYAYIETGIQNIISVNFKDFQQLRTTDNIHVGFIDSRIYLMSNTNTFLNNGTGESTLDVNVVYL